MTEPTPDSTIRAPWTSEQVATLNAFQERGSMHPFTCGNNDHGVSVVLMAHRDGWHCSDPACGYRQDWAHAFMADPEAWPRFPFGERHGPTPLRAELTPMQLLAAHPDVPLPPADRAGLRDRIAEALADIDGWGWVPGFDKNQSPTYQRYLERADVVLAVLPQPVDRAAVLTEAERQFLAHALDLAQDEMHSRPDEFGPEDEAAMERLRRMADEAQQQPDTEPTPPCTCADGGDCFAPAGHYADCPQADQPAVVSQPGKDTTQTQQDEAQEAPPVEPHPTPADLDAALTILDSVHGQDTTAPAAEAQQADTAPVKETTRRYAEQLRATPGTVVADGHTGWECNAGASLIVEASTPGPGKLGTHHGVIYACAAHRAAAVEGITSGGYEVDPRPAPPGHRWNPWPCGHVTAYGADALAALTATGAQQDGGTQ